MPENNNDKGGGAGGDDAAAAAAKAASDAAAAAAAGAGNGNGGGDGEETVTMKKSDLKKIEEDRDNYKAGLLAKKADERDLHNKGGAGAGDGKGGSEGAGAPPAAAVIDEKKVGEVASAAANKTMRDASERTAKRSFLKAHPEYVDDSQWTAMVANLSFRGTEVTVDEVLDRMEAAVLEHKRSTGKLDEYLKSEHERGVREGRIQGELGSGHGTGSAGDRQEGGKGAGGLSPKGEEMARAMHTDPVKAAKVDPSKDNVIEITKV